MKAVNQGDRLPLPANCTPEIYHVMKKCWEKEPENRPNMKDIVEILSEISERDRMEAEAQNAEEMNIYFHQKNVYNQNTRVSDNVQDLNISE